MSFLVYKNYKKVCPICAAVVIAWVLGLVAIYSNATWIEPTIVGILMGASVGALAEKYGRQFGFIWKTLFVLFGLSAIYFIVKKDLYIGFGLLLIILIVTIIYRQKVANATTDEKKDIFKDCCS